MLQQTTVAAVVPFFERFLQRFPDVNSLAGGEEEAVLRLWEGLGYYSRARNLHKAAGIIVEQFNGQMPGDVCLLQSLPGIGRYTAGAIASFAFDLPAPIVEANTLRLYSRLMAMDIDPRSAAGQHQLWDFAEWLVAAEPVQNVMSPGELNQALMDLGATVCTVVDPQCDQCPVAEFCRAFALGQQQQIPSLPKRAAITQLNEASFAVRRNGRFLLRQRTDQERWAGLWDFVRFEVTENDVKFIQNASVRRRKSARRSSRHASAVPSLFASEDAMSTAEEVIPGTTTLPSTWISEIKQRTGLLIQQGVIVTEIRHSVTRYRIRLLCIDAEVCGGRLRTDSGLKWYTARELNELPLSTTGRKFADLLGSRDL